VPEDDDFQFLELVRANTQGSELKTHRSTT
jgi:hypothetical protein